MSFSDRRSTDPVEERASELDEQDIMRKKFKSSQKSLEHNQHFDPVVMSTAERIRACGVNHWYSVTGAFLLSFDFANEVQGLIPI